MGWWADLGSCILADVAKHGVDAAVTGVISAGAGKTVTGGIARLLSVRSEGAKDAALEKRVKAAVLDLAKATSSEVEEFAKYPELEADLKRYHARAEECKKDFLEILERLKGLYALEKCMTSAADEALSQCAHAIENCAGSLALQREQMSAKLQRSLLRTAMANSVEGNQTARRTEAKVEQVGVKVEHVETKVEHSDVNIHVLMDWAVAFTRGEPKHVLLKVLSGRKREAPAKAVASAKEVKKTGLKQRHPVHLSAPRHAALNPAVLGWNTRPSSYAGPIVSFDPENEGWAY